MQNGTGEGREIVNLEELTRAVTASEPAAEDFAPLSNPRRIQRLAELTGTSIRRTCADAGRAVIELVDQADAVVAQLRDDANGFVQSLDEIGNAHAARIERALTHLRGLVETIGNERRRIVALADTQQSPYGQKIHLRRPARSRRFAMVITQEPAQSLAALHGPLTTNVRIPREQQDIAPPLVVSLSVEMLDIFAQCPSQRALTEENHLGQALLLHRPDPALRIGIQVRAACRQHERLDLP
jgi:hypothetical protein